MLADCAVVKSIWQVIDQLGNAHWKDYTPLVYDLIPDILRSYDPINIYDISCVCTVGFLGHMVQALL